MTRDERLGAIDKLCPQVFHSIRMNNNKARGRGGDIVKIQIFQIKVNDGRREVSPEAVHELANSISELGLMNPSPVPHCMKEYIPGQNNLRR